MKNKLFSIMLVVFMVAMSLVTLVGCTVTYVSIRIDSEAMKTDYVKGEALSYEGLKVYATTDKGEEVELTAEQYTLSVEAGTKVEKKTTITVALVDQPEISEKFNVKCHNEIVSAEIKTHAAKLEYLVGERFDATGLVVTVTRENGEKEDVTDGFTYKTDPLTVEDTTIEITVGAQKVTETLTIIRGVFIEAEDGIIVSNDADINSDSPDATGGLYVGDMKSGNTLTFVFNASKAGEADITFRLASQYLKADSSWTPIWMGDCQLNKIMKVYVNGVEQSISDDIILPGGGGPDGEPDANLWFNWREVVFGAAQLVEGENTVMIEFIPHDYNDCSQSSFNGKFTANIDSMKVETSDIDISVIKPLDDGVSEYVATTASLEDLGGKATLVISGTYVPGADATEESLVAALSEIYFDFQGNPYVVSGSWEGDWEYRVLTCVGVEVDTANNTYVAKYDLSQLTEFAYTGHYGSSSTDCKPTGESFTKELTVGSLKYTLSYVNGSGAAEEFWGCIGLRVEAA